MNFEIIEDEIREVEIIAGGKSIQDRARLFCARFLVNAVLAPPRPAVGGVQIVSAACRKVLSLTQRTIACG
jgi:hypothetical protein